MPPSGLSGPAAVGRPRWKQKEEAKRQMYLQSTEKGPTLRLVGANLKKYNAKLAAGTLHDPTLKTDVPDRKRKKIEGGGAPHTPARDATCTDTSRGSRVRACARVRARQGGGAV